MQAKKILPRKLLKKFFADVPRVLPLGSAAREAIRLRKEIQAMKESHGKTLKALQTKVRTSQQRIASVCDVLEILAEKIYQPDGAEKKTHATAQERMWASSYGIHYLVKGLAEDGATARRKLWEMVEKALGNSGSVLELGCNLGMNLKAIEAINEKAALTGVEINTICCELLRKAKPAYEVINDSILEFESDRKWDFVFTRGVLIHINPEFLPAVYKKMASLSNRYVYLMENYNDEVISNDHYPSSGQGIDRSEHYFWRRDFFTEFEQHNPGWKRVEDFVWPPSKQKADHGAAYCVLFEKV